MLPTYIVLTIYGLAEWVIIVNDSKCVRRERGHRKLENISNCISKCFSQVFIRFYSHATWIWPWLMLTSFIMDCTAVHSNFTGYILILLSFIFPENMLENTVYDSWTCFCYLSLWSWLDKFFHAYNPASQAHWENIKMQKEMYVSPKFGYTLFSQYRMDCHEIFDRHLWSQVDESYWLMVRWLFL